MINVSKPNTESFRKAFTEAMAKGNAKFVMDKSVTVHITIKMFFPRPKKHFVKHEVTESFHLSSTAPVHVTKTPDLDNCLKLVLDALQGVVCSNDSQVAQITATKLFDPTHKIWDAKTQAEGCTLIKVSQVNEATTADNCKCPSCQQKLKHKSN